MKSRGMGRISSAVCEEAYLADMSFEALSESMRILGLIHRATQEGEKDEHIFAITRSFLEVLKQRSISEKPDRSLLLGAAFVMKFLRLLGGGIVTEVCVSCGDNFASGWVFASAESGGLLCEKCRSVDSRATAIDREAVKLLRVFSAHTFPNIAKIHASKNHIRQARLFLDQCFERMLR
jgi:DNA repair protein RecO